VTVVFVDVDVDVVVVAPTTPLLVAVGEAVVAATAVSLSAALDGTSATPLPFVVGMVAALVAVVVVETVVDFFLFDFFLLLDIFMIMETTIIGTVQK
jgi:hypothetical protein